MRVLVVVVMSWLLLSCGATRVEDMAGNNSITCITVDAATLFSMFSATTSFRSVQGPENEDGTPAATFDQLLEAEERCWQDPQAAALIEAIRALSNPL